MSCSNSSSWISVRRGVPKRSLIARSSLAQHLEQLGVGGEDGEIAGDLLDDLLELAGDLVALEPGQAVQAQIEDRARLLLREPVGAVHHPAPRLVDRA